MKNKCFQNTIYFSNILTTLMITSLLLTSNSVSAVPTDIFTADFDTQVEDLMNIAKIESLALSVVNGTEEFYAIGYGDQPEIDTIFYINDISGVIATTALFQLMDDGLFDIDDPVNDYLPWIIRNPYYPDTLITIHDILSQRAGIELSLETLIANNNHIFPFPDVLYELFNENGSYYTIDSWLNIVPGSTYEGEWINYDLTAFLVELISNEPYEQYVADNIFVPLGMTSTEFTYTNYTLSQLAKQYYWNSTSGINEELSYLDTYIYAPGSAGVLSTAGDLSKFLIVHMNDGVYENITILEESSVHLMHSNLGNDRGLGWDNDVVNDFQGLMGSNYGDTFMLTKENVGVIVFTDQCLYLEGFAGKIRDIANYISTTAEELILIPPTDPTDTSIELIAIPVFLAILESAIVYRKKFQK